MSEDHHVPVRRSAIFQFLKFTVIVFVIVTPFRYFVAQPFIVSGASMEPTFEPKEYLVIDEITYRFEKPHRGDVIIFRYPLDPDVFFVKRVIGLPGERVVIHEGLVTIYGENGSSMVLEEPYLAQGAKSDSTSLQLDEGEYFVMGDNRRASSDSRVWGPLQERFIIGRPLARLFPFSEAGLLPGVHSFGEE